MTNCKNCGHDRMKHARAVLIKDWTFENVDIFSTACYECGKCEKFEL